ncbi:AAEL002421-PA, partial [Aedes aegypti]
LFAGILLHKEGLTSYWWVCCENKAKEHHHQQQQQAAAEGSKRLPEIKQIKSTLAAEAKKENVVLF